MPKPALGNSTTLPRLLFAAGQYKERNTHQHILFTYHLYGKIVDSIKELENQPSLEAKYLRSVPLNIVVKTVLIKYFVYYEI